MLGSNHESKSSLGYIAKLGDEGGGWHVDKHDGLAVILILQRWKQIDAKFKAIFGYTASRPTWAT